MPLTNEQLSLFEHVPLKFFAAELKVVFGMLRVATVFINELAVYFCSGAVGSDHALPS